MNKMLTALALLIGLSTSASAATVDGFLNNEGKVVVTLEGEIKPGDAKKIQDIINMSRGKNRQVIAVRLNSPGGNLMEGVNIADIVNDNKLATVVMNNTMCASACFIAFAAGHEKWASARSSLGVHGAANKDGKQDADSMTATIVMAKILNMMHVPPSVIGKMVITPPEEMVWLKLPDMKEWDVHVTGMPKGAR